MGKTTIRLAVRLDAADRDFVRDEAERIGVDSATLVRMLIRQARTMPVQIEPTYPQEPEQTFEQLLAAPPSLMDEQPAPIPAPAGQQLTDARPRYQRPVTVPPGAFRAGSMTRAVGVGDGTQGNVIGDARGNVIRENYAHFGFVGTRSR